MNELAIILRFRDLVTDDGGTIREHIRILERQGQVWWGWWMRQFESAPHDLFRELANTVEKDGLLTGFLFDSGRDLLFRTTIKKIRTAPPGGKISAPDVEYSPAYYQQGKYPAWFLLVSIQPVELEAIHVTFDTFPTLSTENRALELVGKELSSLEQLRSSDATLWCVKWSERT